MQRTPGTPPYRRLPSPHMSLGPPRERRRGASRRTRALRPIPRPSRPRRRRRCRAQSRVAAAAPPRGRRRGRAPPWAHRGHRPPPRQSSTRRAAPLYAGGHAGRASLCPPLSSRAGSAPRGRPAARGAKCALAPTPQPPARPPAATVSSGGRPRPQRQPPRSRRTWPSPVRSRRCVQRRAAVARRRTGRSRRCRWPLSRDSARRTRPRASSPAEAKATRCSCWPLASPPPIDPSPHLREDGEALQLLAQRLAQRSAH